MNSSAAFVAAAEPLPGRVPNFEHPDDVYHTANTFTNVLCLTMMTLFFAARVYVKTVIKRGEFLLEDWFCVASWILTTALGLCFIMMTHYGEGYHVWELSEQAFQNYLTWLYMSTLLYNPAAFATKVSLLLMIARVFSVHQRVSLGIRIMCVVFAVMYLPIQGIKVRHPVKETETIILPPLTHLSSQIFVCNPISTYWTDTSHLSINGANPRCMNQAKLFAVDQILAIIADFIILVMPIPLTLSMRLSARVRLRIIFMLSVGGSALGAVVLKLYKTFELLPSDDITVSFSVLSILS
ncbi:hypothetical protein N0V93_007986 [Gnomoniopsis smithogilvyi]|uniref:Rhodopsin domain-containing protein n=1 Tax=Gnomoniopsis smithogilvyi TaxID=1191159 RepID=A0A9W8YKV4_9PEZI|nr:hypothetical protein N0V93_007986 [Gnomoniopsis smithogilvyi]